ncbi:MAG: hypothetical protein K8T10_18570 [Candidatus Eremiobacteraeota bacterium]|nr:hypothetical protein [Candidatus Eremiobacteraeota bacterium]
MFGLFSNKRKKFMDVAHTRATNWWKALNVQGIKENSRFCHLCRVEIPRMQGYLFKPRDVINNEKYMETEIGKLEARKIPPEDAQEIIWKRIETDFDDWLICDTCIERFI